MLCKVDPTSFNTDPTSLPNNRGRARKEPRIAVEVAEGEVFKRKRGRPKKDKVPKGMGLYTNPDSGRTYYNVSDFLQS